MASHVATTFYKMSYWYITIYVAKGALKSGEVSLGIPYSEPPLSAGII